MANAFKSDVSGSISKHDKRFFIACFFTYRNFKMKRDVFGMYKVISVPVFVICFFLQSDLLTKSSEKLFTNTAKNKECCNGDVKHLIGLDYED